MMYGDDDEQGRLPPATDNKGDYHSIRLSDFTFTNLVDTTWVVRATVFIAPTWCMPPARWAGMTPSAGYTIGYSYLAAAALPADPERPRTKSGRDR